MAFDESSFINHALAPPLTADEASLSYLASSGHGGPRFKQDLVAPSYMQASGAQLVGVPLPLDTSFDRYGFSMVEGSTMVASYNALSDVPTRIAVPPLPNMARNNNPTSYKRSWTDEEDRILKDMVMQFGERNWSMIAQYLPGRIGKQCRERWINHLHPNIKDKNTWTEEDDQVLIQAHRQFGNHWSLIASRFLPGRAENSIKNHWNSSKRSLKTKHLLNKKSDQVPPRKLSILEEYIDTLPQDTESTPPPPIASTLPQSLANNGFIDLGPLHKPALKIENNTNAANPAALPLSLQQGTINPNIPMMPDLKMSRDPQEASYMSYPMCPPMPALQLQLVTQDHQQACFPFADYLMEQNLEIANGRSCNSGGSYSNTEYYGEVGPSNPGANRYYSEAGPSSAGHSGGEPASDTEDIIDLALREFLTPSKDEATLNLTGFM